MNAIKIREVFKYAAATLLGVLVLDLIEPPHGLIWQFSSPLAPVAELLPRTGYDWWLYDVLFVALLLLAGLIYRRTFWGRVLLYSAIGFGIIRAVMLWSGFMFGLPLWAIYIPFLVPPPVAIPTQ